MAVCPDCVTDVDRLFSDGHLDLCCKIILFLVRVSLGAYVILVSYYLQVFSLSQVAPCAGTYVNHVRNINIEAYSELDVGQRSSIYHLCSTAKQMFFTYF